MLSTLTKLNFYHFQIVNDKLNLEVFMAGWGSLDVEAKHTVTDCYNQGK